MVEQTIIDVAGADVSVACTPKHFTTRYVACQGQSEAELIRRGGAALARARSLGGVLGGG
jgi:hypothetical protein